MRQSCLKNCLFVAFPTIQVSNKSNKINQLVRGTLVAVASLKEME